MFWSNPSAKILLSNPGEICFFNFKRNCVKNLVLKLSTILPDTWSSSSVEEKRRSSGLLGVS